MQIQQDHHGILGIDYQRRTAINGPGQTKRDQQMAGTNYSQTSQGVLRIWKFLLTFHTKILQIGSSIEQSAKERYAIRLDPSMPRIVRYLEEKIHQRTGPHDARSLPNFPNQIRHIKICIRSGTYSNGLKWRQTPSGIYVENVQQYRKTI